jgi:hypothetical protein
MDSVVLIYGLMILAVEVSLSEHVSLNPRLESEIQICCILQVSLQLG